MMNQDTTHDTLTEVRTELENTPCTVSVDTDVNELEVSTTADRTLYVSYHATNGIEVTDSDGWETYEGFQSIEEVVDCVCDQLGALRPLARH